MTSPNKLVRPSLSRGVAQPGLSSALLCIALTLALAAVSVAQKPVAQLPTGISLSNGSYVGTVMPTSYVLPTGGTTWAAHNSSQFTSALNTSIPGDVIVLDAGVTYVGNFHLPAKSNPNTSGFTSSARNWDLPKGHEYRLASVPDMATVVTPNASPAFSVAWGQTIGVLLGLRCTRTLATLGVWRYRTAELLHVSVAVYTVGAVIFGTNHIFVDRCYVHGDATHDIQIALQANFTYFALIDSYVSGFTDT